MFGAEAKGGPSTGGRRKAWGRHSWALIKGVCWTEEGNSAQEVQFREMGGGVDCCQVEDRTGEGQQGVGVKLVLTMSAYLSTGVPTQLR